MRTFYLLANMIAAFACFSCSKNGGPEKQMLDCRLLQNVRYDAGTAMDTFDYQYNDLGQIVAVNGRQFSYLLEYEKNKIVRRRYTLPGATEHLAQDLVHYNPGGSISRIEQFDKNDNLLQTTVFTYNNNKLTNLSFYDAGNVLRAKYDYTYTINNITAINADESWNGVNRSFRYKLSYDTQPNNFRHGQQALLMDGFLNHHMPLTTIYVLSDNRVKTYEANGQLFPVTYAVDEQNNVTSLMVGTEPMMRGTYDCK